MSDRTSAVTSRGGLHAPGGAEHAARDEASSGAGIVGSGRPSKKKPRHAPVSGGGATGAPDQAAPATEPEARVVTRREETRRRSLAKDTPDNTVKVQDNNVKVRTAAQRILPTHPTHPSRKIPVALSVNAARCRPAPRRCNRSSQASTPCASILALRGVFCVASIASVL